MSSHRYQEGELVVGKLGTNPWWPGVVTKCGKQNRYHIDSGSSSQVYVKFLEINIEAWLEMGNVMICLSRQDMEQYMSSAQQGSSNCKYVNYIPPAMEELYSKSWQLYEKMQNKRSNHREKFDDNELSVIDRSSVVGMVDGQANRSPCEICLNKEIEFDCGEKNKSILEMSEDERRRHFDRFLISDDSDREVKCSNNCSWRYHGRCAASDDDFVCSCNKSVWICSVCREPISVSQLFVCDSDECMRPYHRACLGAQFDWCIDTGKLCPLHRCVNCCLDYLVPIQDGFRSQAPTLVHCVKCRLAFHNDPDCLPAPGTFLSITEDLIICHRHLIETNLLSLLPSNSQKRFCFTCGQSILNDQHPVSCKFCPVAYHNCHSCLPSWIDPITTTIDNSRVFVCNGCRFPYVRRGSSYFVMDLSSSSLTDGNQLSIDQKSSISNVRLLKLGVPIDAVGTDTRSVAIRSDDGNKYIGPVHRLISINLQSIDHLVCLGWLRFSDMQRALRHLSDLVSRVSSKFGLKRVFSRNAFVLQFADLFPVNQNLYLADVSALIARIDPSNQSSTRCQCQDSCSTLKCVNLAAGSECSEATCASIQNCRNRRLQKRQHSRYRLEPGSCVGEGDDRRSMTVILEETVAKDVLVTELVGQVKLKSWAASSQSVPGFCVAALSSEAVIDCSRFCSLARFIRVSDRPNLKAKCLTVIGAPRIGLFSTRRILKGEELTVEAGVYMNSSNAVETQNSTLRTYDESVEVKEEEPVIIDLCSDEPDKPIDISDDNDEIDSRYGRPPLCQLCLLELCAETSSTRFLVHCKACYAVVHFHCALETLEFGQDMSTAFNRYICPLCSPLMEM